MADEINNLSQEMDNLRNSMQGLGQTTDRASDELLNSFKALGNSLLGTAKALKGGETGASVFNNSLQSTASVISTALTLKFGLLGAAAGKLTTALASYAGDVNKLSDTLVSTYGELSKFGVATAEGSRGIYDLNQQLGYGVEELGKLQNIVARNAEALSILGGTSARGAQALGEVAQGIQRTGLVREFRNLGLGFDEINNGIAFYLQIQARTGRAQQMTTQQLTAGSAEYLRQLDLLTKLTGKSAETLQEEERERMADQQFRAVQRQLQIKAAAGDVDAAKKLEETRKLLSQLGPEGRKAVIQAMTGFVGAGKEGQKLFLTSNRAFTELNKQSFNASDVMQMLAEDGQRTADAFGGSLAALGLYNETFLDFAGTLDLSAKAIKDTYQVQEENAVAQQNLQKSALEQATQNAIDIELANRRTRDALQNFTEAGLKPVTGAMKFLSDVTRGAAENLVPFSKGRVGRTPELGGPATTTPITPGPKTTPLPPTVAPGPKPTPLPPTIAPGPKPTPAPTAPSAAPASVSGITPGRSTINPNAEIVSVLNAGPGFNVVETTDGNQRRTGNRNWRNNNPGNIEYGQYAIKAGSVGSDGRFAIFPTIEHGNRAKENLLFGASSRYVNLSIRDAIGRYAPSTENATEMYIREVAKAAGVADTTKLAELSTNQRQSVLNAINRIEGFKPGTVTPAQYGGIIQSRAGGTLLQAAEAGLNEAYVPLPNGRSIPVELPEMRTQVEMMGVQIGKLDELISVMRSSNNISSKILQVTRA